MTDTEPRTLYTREEAHALWRLGYRDGLAAARATAPAGLREGTAWLIERGQPEGQSPTVWWGVTDSRTGAYGWVDSAWAADQFATREEAQAVIDRFDLPNHPFHARAVEHGFVRDLLASEPTWTHTDHNDPAGLYDDHWEPRRDESLDPHLLKEAMLAVGPVGGVHQIDFQQAFASVHLSQQQLAMEFAEAVAAEYQRRTPEGYRRMPRKRRGTVR